MMSELVKNKRIKISIFIPVFNEEGIIRQNISRIRKVIEQLPEDFEIFFVDDASTDRSNEILNEITEEDTVIKHLRYENGPTRRENLTQSFKYASGEVVVMFDMDLAANLKYLQRLIYEVSRNDYDISIGSRYLKDSVVRRSFYRKLISIVFIKFLNLYFNSKISDYVCGFKAFKREVILDLLDKLGYDKTLNRGVFWDAEMLIRAVRKGYKIKEIPIEWNEGAKSALYFKREIRMLPYILKFKGRLENE